MAAVRNRDKARTHNAAAERVYSTVHLLSLPTLSTLLVTNPIAIHHPSPSHLSPAVAIITSPPALVSPKSRIPLIANQGLVWPALYL